MKILVAHQNDTLDSLIYRHYGKTAGLLEQALALNPQLAAQPILRLGQEVKMPIDATSTTQNRAVVQLWD